MIQKLFPPKETETSVVQEDPIKKLQSLVEELQRDVANGRHSTQKRFSLMYTIIVPLIILALGLYGLSVYFNVDLSETFSSASQDVSRIVSSTSLPVTANTLEERLRDQADQFNLILAEREDEIASLKEENQKLLFANEDLLLEEELRRKSFQSFVITQNAAMLAFITSQITGGVVDGSDDLKQEILAEEPVVVGSSSVAESLDDNLSN